MFLFRNGIKLEFEWKGRADSVVYSIAIFLATALELPLAKLLPNRQSNHGRTNDKH